VPDNWNCDGSGPHSSNPEVRVYPLGAGGNLILCSKCFYRENQWRAQRTREVGDKTAWPQIDWNTAEVYSNQERANAETDN
jgi:hypothetical protein